MASRVVLLFLSFLFRCSPTQSTLWQNSPLVSTCHFRGDDRAETLPKSTTTGVCALECHRRPWCNSFHYTPLLDECRLCSLHYLDSDVILDTGRTKYYRSTSDECSLTDGFIWDRGSDMCLVIVSQADVQVITWRDALERCANHSLRLVTLDTPARLHFVIRSLRYNDRFQDVDFFIGARRPTSMWGEPWPQGVPDFQWASKDATVDTNNTEYWADGQPDNRLTKDNVLALRADLNFLLSDDTDTSLPNQTFGYICEK